MINDGLHRVNGRQNKLHIVPKYVICPFLGNYGLIKLLCSLALEWNCVVAVVKGEADGNDVHCVVERKNCDKFE